MGETILSSFRAGGDVGKAAVKVYISPGGAYKAVSKVYKQLETSKEWERIQENRRGAQRGH